MEKEKKIQTYKINNFYKIILFVLIQISIFMIANRVESYGLEMSLYALSILIACIFAWWISKESKKQFLHGTQIKNIKKLIKEGKLVFVIKRGIFSFGVPFAIITYLFDVGFVWDTNWILWSLIFSVLICGTVYGLVLWWWANRKISANKS